MSLSYVAHEKLSLRKHPVLNEKWVHERICDDPTVLQLGEVRVLDMEKSLPGGGRLDMLLFNEDTETRYEVEVMLGATDPSHIIRTIEYWDIERRRYPGYDHVAVIIAENITSRFLNVISLMSGTIPIVALQLDALKVGDNVLLNFVKVLDQAELRVDDTEEDSGGGEVDRAFWEKKAGSPLMGVCDQVVAMVNEGATVQHEANYLQRYIGLRANGVVNNFIYLSPKPSKKLAHITMRAPGAAGWLARFQEDGAPVSLTKNHRLKLSVTAEEFAEHSAMIREAIIEAVKEKES